MANQTPFISILEGAKTHFPTLRAVAFHESDDFILILLNQVKQGPAPGQDQGCQRLRNEPGSYPPQL